MADRWIRQEQLNITVGGTNRQDGFKKLNKEVDSAYECDNTLSNEITSISTSVNSHVKHMNPIVASILFGGG